MAARRLKMRKIREILRMKHERELPHRSIARSLHMSIGTVSEYLAKAKDIGVSWPLPSELDDAQLEAQLFPRRAESQTRSKLDFSNIHKELRGTGVTLLQLWVEYATDRTATADFVSFIAVGKRS